MLLRGRKVCQFSYLVQRAGALPPEPELFFFKLRPEALIGLNTSTCLLKISRHFRMDFHSTESTIQYANACAFRKKSHTVDHVNSIRILLKPHFMRKYMRYSGETTHIGWDFHSTDSSSRMINISLRLPASCHHRRCDKCASKNTFACWGVAECQTDSFAFMHDGFTLVKIKCRPENIFAWIKVCRLPRESFTRRHLRN